MTVSTAALDTTIERAAGAPARASAIRPTHVAPEITNPSPAIGSFPESVIVRTVLLGPNTTEIPAAAIAAPPSMSKASTRTSPLCHPPTRSTTSTASPLRTGWLQSP